MTLPETKVTKTANTMDWTAIFFSPFRFIRLSGWTMISARKLITDKINIMIIDVKRLSLFANFLNVSPCNILSDKINEVNIIFRLTISCNNNSFIFTLTCPIQNTTSLNL